MAKFRPKYGEENIDYFTTPRPKRAIRLRGARRELRSQVVRNVGEALLIAWPLWVGAAVLAIAGEVKTWWVLGLVASVLLGMGIVAGLTEWRSRRREDDRKAVRQEQQP